MNEIDVFNSYKEACEDGCMWGVDHILLTMEHIGLLLQGKALKTDNGEYVQIIEIENIPNSDAVEVVRCKDCKHYFHYGDGVYGCRAFGMMKTRPDGFCSYGERRSNGE